MVVDANIERSLGCEGLEVKRWPRVLKNLAHTLSEKESLFLPSVHFKGHTMHQLYTISS